LQNVIKYSQDMKLFIQIVLVLLVVVVVIIT